MASKQETKPQPNREFSAQIQFRVRPETRKRFEALCEKRLVSRNMAGDKALSELCDRLENDEF